MSAAAIPRFGHVQDFWVYEANVRAGRPLCERCHGGGNEFWAMYKACSECGGSGIDPNWTPPAPPPPPKPWELSPTGGACCPPSWPEWAATEEGDWVWIRADLEADAERVLRDVGAYVWLDTGDGYMLERRGRVAMALELEDTQWAEGWLLTAVALEADPQDAVVYVEFEVCVAPLSSEGGGDGD